MAYLSRIFLVIIVSGIKFLGGISLAFTYKLSIPELLVYTVAGGMLGVVLMLYFSHWIDDAAHWIWQKSTLFIHHVQSKPKPDVSRRKKKIFSPRSRRMVKLSRKYGLIGIAILTPVLLSIPIGTYIANRLVHSHQRKRVLLLMFISVSSWAVLIAVVSLFFRKVPGI